MSPRHHPRLTYWTAPRSTLCDERDCIRDEVDRRKTRVSGTTKFALMDIATAERNTYGRARTRAFLGHTSDVCLMPRSTAISNFAETSDRKCRPGRPCYSRTAPCQ